MRWSGSPSERLAPGTRLGRALRFRGFLVPACFLAAGVVLSGCLSVPLLNRAVLSVSMGRPFVIAQSDKSLGWGFYAHPFLYDLAENLIVVAYHSEGDSWDRDLGARASFDRGKTWSEFDFTNFPVRNDLGAIFHKPDGSRCLTSRRQKDYQFHVLDISDSGVFSPATNACYMPVETNRHVSMMIRGVVAPGGELLVGAHAYLSPYQESGALYDLRRTSCVLMSSSDQGRSFHYVSTIATPDDAPWGNEGPCEPAVVRLPNGDLVSVMRTGSMVYPAFAGGGSPNMIHGRSSDGGKNWKLRRMMIPGVMPKLVRMSNGVLVCAFGRPGNNLIFSIDDGKTWGREVAITSCDIRTTGYCDLIEVEPGRLLVVYDAFNMDMGGFWLWEPREVNGLIGVFVDVKYRGPAPRSESANLP